MNFTEPLDVFFGATAMFAETASYTHAGGSAATIAGVFWNESAEQYGIEARVPRFQTKTSNVSSLARADSIVVAGVTYKVQDWEYDATGLVVTLDLEKQ